MSSKSSHPAIVTAVWDDEAQVWIASSDDIAGLVIEAETVSDLRKEIDLILPDLLELIGSDKTQMEYILECSTPKTLSL